MLCERDLPPRNWMWMAIRVGNRSNSGVGCFCINKSEERRGEGRKEGKEFHEFPHDSLAKVFKTCGYS